MTMALPEFAGTVCYWMSRYLDARGQSTRTAESMVDFQFLRPDQSRRGGGSGVGWGAASKRWQAPRLRMARLTREPNGLHAILTIDKKKQNPSSIIVRGRPAAGENLRQVRGARQFGNGGATHPPYLQGRKTARFQSEGVVAAISVCIFRAVQEGGAALFQA